MKYLYIYLVLIFIILFFSFKNSLSIPKKEAFHPYIRQWYRPIIRNTRIYSKKWYNNINEGMYRFWRKNILLK
jgi:hypothetical protein